MSGIWKVEAARPRPIYAAKARRLQFAWRIETKSLTFAL